MLKHALFAAALAVASPALAQSGTTYQPYSTNQDSSTQGTPPQQGTGTGTTTQQQGQDQQQPGQQPSGSGAASQQVVVNPPQPSGAATAQQQSPPQQQPPAPPPSTTVVTPPPPSTTVVSPPPRDYGQVVVEERVERNPMATIAMDAAYGGVAGLLVGFGVALVNDWDNWDRSLMVGAGSGLIIGSLFGIGHVAYEAREDRRRRDRYAFDGLGSTARHPVLSARTMAGVSGRF
jgi:hypothetical protein